MKIFFKLFFLPILVVSVLSFGTVFINWGFIGIGNLLWLLSPTHKYIQIGWALWFILCYIITYFYKKDNENNI